jgi:hypothetical protein
MEVYFPIPMVVGTGLAGMEVMLIRLVVCLLLEVLFTIELELIFIFPYIQAFK